ncbi:MAG TPA: SDR family NAD(P)-dependent oxidoreductase, partial [Sphingopyxis sp.]|nr:SDR family NAD(P)-dependent oxidoreductase [Sphingopyxis sp.]
MRLEGKTALITGAARGIGLEFARAYIAEGAAVALADIDGAGVRAAAATLGPHAMAVEMDVTRQGSIDDGFAEAIARLGKIDILINNAALFTAAPIADISRADYDRTFAVNVAGSLFCLQAAARHMIARGAGGKIINMASQAGRRGEPLVGVYCASKAAVISLTQSAGLNLIKHGINVNGIAPGVVGSEMWDEMDALFAKYE